MILDGLQELLNHYYDTLYGLRTGQTGKANAHFEQLLILIASRLESRSNSIRLKAMPVINAMLAAKERDDAIALADVIQYELPGAIEDDHISPILLDMAVFAQLRALDATPNGPDRTDAITRTLSQLACDQHAKDCRGLATYHALQSYVGQRYEDTLKLLAADEHAGRGTAAGTYLMALATMQLGDLPGAVKTMSRAYRDCTTIHDGYAQLALISAAREHWSEALTLARRDQDNGRLSGAGKIGLAHYYHRTGDPDHAAKLVTEAYIEDPNLNDGFAGLAWLAAEKRQWPTARRLMERDAERGRLSANRRADFSFILAHLEDWSMAERQVAEAYTADPALRDRYGWLGWIGYLQGKGADFLRSQIEADIRQDRYATWGQVFTACHAAAMGNIQDAVEKVETAYTEAPDQHSWFCAIGWLCVKSGDIPTGCALMERDHRAERLPDFWKPSYAVALAMDEQREKALSVLRTMDPRHTIAACHPIGYWHVPDACLSLADLESCLPAIHRLADLATFAEPMKPGANTLPPLFTTS